MRLHRSIPATILITLVSVCHAPPAGPARQEFTDIEILEGVVQATGIAEMLVEEDAILHVSGLDLPAGYRADHGRIPVCACAGEAGGNPCAHPGASLLIGPMAEGRVHVWQCVDKRHLQTLADVVVGWRDGQWTVVGARRFESTL